MRTHDEDAFAYFKHTKVVCKLCPRLHHKFPTLFAHHQKTVTVDTRAAHGSLINGREIMSFVGGVDLCDGRYDTEQHSLFRTLNMESLCFDFYQTNISGASLHKGGPREPWHDAHACITGEAAWDVLANFEERWNKQCDPSLLPPINSIPNLIRQPFSSSNPDESDDRNWKVQVFRSIDHVSTNQLSKNLTVEQSIHEAYVEAIRRAMWPEGVPESEPVHDILNFFCLANREKESKEEFVPPQSPHPSTQYWKAQKHRRFMVYVHSKVMIGNTSTFLILYFFYTLFIYTFLFFLFYTFFIYLYFFSEF